MNAQKAPRTAHGFTSNASKKLAETISKHHFNHSITVEKIDNDVATLKIHKFKSGKGKPAKDYKATVKVLRLWHGNIADFTDFKIV